MGCVPHPDHHFAGIYFHDVVNRVPEHGSVAPLGGIDRVFYTLVFFVRYITETGVK
jgi:hypothetical protein